MYIFNRKQIVFMQILFCRDNSRTRDRNRDFKSSGDRRDGRSYDRKMDHGSRDGGRRDRDRSTDSRDSRQYRPERQRNRSVLCVKIPQFVYKSLFMMV